MDVNIRKALPSDAETVNMVLKLAFKSYSEAACYNAARGALEETVAKTRDDIENKLFYVAEFDGKIVGSVRVILEEKTAYLSRFSVLPEYHKFGVGKKLIDYVDVKMTEKSISSIYLHTAQDVEYLINFYKRCGFVIESVSEDSGYKRAYLRKNYGE